MNETANKNLAEVKLALAKKYENLARLTKSMPKRKNLMIHAGRFRRQAERLVQE